MFCAETRNARAACRNSFFAVMKSSLTGGDFNFLQGLKTFFRSRFCRENGMLRFVRNAMLQGNRNPRTAFRVGASEALFAVKKNPRRGDGDFSVGKYQSSSIFS